MYCHWYVVAPVAVSVNVAVSPIAAVWLVGWLVISNATDALTVSVADSVVSAVPFTPVTTQRYCAPLFAAAAVTVSVVPVSPSRSVHTVSPLSPFTPSCH